MANISARVKSDPNRFAIFQVAVSKVQRLSEHFVRVSLTGPGLHAFTEPVGKGEGWLYDTYIKLLVPPPGRAEPTRIELNETWRRDWFALPETQRGWMRTYTVRACRGIEAATAPAVSGEVITSSVVDVHVPMPLPLPSWQPEIDIDFVLHADAAGNLGPGAAWAANAQVGDAVSLMGPLASEPLWASWNPEGAQRAILCADETAVPAALSIVQSVPQDCELDVLLEIPCADDALSSEASLISPSVLERENLRLHWVPRGQSAARGVPVQRKLREILGLPVVSTSVVDASETESQVLWELAENTGDTYVFIAGESSTVRSLRRICVNEAGIDKKSISFMGYWKEGRAES